MKLDQVHDLQRTYRKLLACMARPGTVGQCGAELERIDIEVPFNKAFLLFGLTLLDAETTLAVVSETAPDFAGFLARMTYARTAPASEASFIFLPAPKKGLELNDEVRELLLGTSRGTLIDPHRGATVIIETGTLSSKSGDVVDATRYRLVGPGIKRSSVLDIAGSDALRLSTMVHARNEACSEFPLGIDLILLDAKGSFVCIPRTTRMEVA